MRPQPGSVRRKLAGLGLAQWPGMTPGMAYWRALVFCVLIALFFGGVNSLPARAGYAPFCADGGSPFFRDELAYLKEEVGRPMGQPIECAHRDDVTGDTLQHTSTGLAYVRAWDGLATFTDGWHRWALTQDGLIAWEGPAIDPPGWTPPPSAASPRSPDAAGRAQSSNDNGSGNDNGGHRSRRTRRNGETAIRIRTPTTMSRPRATTIIEAGTTTTSPRRHHRAPPSLLHRHRRRLLRRLRRRRNQRLSQRSPRRHHRRLLHRHQAPASASGSAATTGSSSARAAARRGSAARPLSRPSYESTVTRSAGGILRTRTERTRVAARRPAARAA